MSIVIFIDVLYDYQSCNHHKHDTFYYCVGFSLLAGPGGKGGGYTKIERRKKQRAEYYVRLEQ